MAMISAEVEMKRALATQETEYLSLHICRRAGSPLSIFTQLELLHFSVCIEGEAGSGKTTFAWHLCNLWGQGQILRNMKAVMIVDMQACLNASSLEDVLLRYSKKLNLSESTKIWLESLIKYNRDKVLLVFDGLDEFSQGSNDSRFAYKFLIESVQLRAPVLLLGQPGTGNHLSQLHIRVDSHFEMLGFKDDEISKYVSRQVARSVSRSVEEYMREQQWIQKLCKNPRLTSILVESLKKDCLFLQELQTSMLHSLLLQFVAAECPNCTSSPSLFQLPADPEHILQHISHIALICTLTGNEQELSHINLNEGVSSLEELGNLGLVYQVGNSIQFLAESSKSAVIKLFLCAYYVSQLSLSKQVEFYCDYSGRLLSSLSLVATFLFGLGRLNHHGWFDSGKLALGSAMECLARHVQLEQDSLRKRKKTLSLLCCIHETREISLIRSLISQFPGLPVIELPNAISKYEQSAIAFMITHSGIKEWHIESSNKESDDKLALFFATLISKEVKIHVLIEGRKESAVFSVKPAPEAMPVAKKSDSALAFVKCGTTDYEKEELFRHAVQCNAQREALHRVFNPYSKVKLRSDAGNPAYFSFITCQCMEVTLRSEAVVLEPIHPVHSVKLAAKNKKAKEIEAEREPAKMHIEEEHDECCMEVIVLSKPYPKSLTFQPQGSSETCQLVLSTDELPSCMAGRIAMETRESILDNRYLVQCVAESGEQKVKNIEMVMHGLPLPKSKSRSGANKANILPGGQKANGKRSGEGPAAGSDLPATAAQVALSHPYKNLQGDEPVLSPVPAQAESSEKVTWRPGITSILVESLEKDHLFLRESQTSVLHSLLLKFVAVECPNCSSSPSLFQLPADPEHILQHISHIALVCTLTGNNLHEEELSHINLNEGVSSLKELGNLYQVGNSIQFLAESSKSAVIKLFLCAYYVSRLSLSEQVEFYCDSSSRLLSSLSLVATFLFGLGRLNHHGWFDSGKLALGSAVECLARHVQLEQDSLRKRKKTLSLLCCIRESREISHS